MGIYTNGLIYGIRIEKLSDNDEYYIIYEKKDNIALSPKKINQVRLFYEELIDKNNLVFTIYIECNDTYDKGIYNIWSPISLDSFLKII